MAKHWTSKGHICHHNGSVFNGEPYGIAEGKAVWGIEAVFDFFFSGATGNGEKLKENTVQP